MVAKVLMVDYLNPQHAADMVFCWIAMLVIPWAAKSRYPKKLNRL